MKSLHRDLSQQVAQKQIVPMTDQRTGLASACLGTKTPPPWRYRNWSVDKYVTQD